MLIETWEDVFTRHQVFRVNGCLETTITMFEVMDSGDYESLIMLRLLPLAFLAMPVHDLSPFVDDSNFIYTTQKGV